MFFNILDMCDFESSLCGWTTEDNKDGSFYWQIGSGLVKGPKIDHTTSSEFGRYTALNNIS